MKEKSKQIKMDFDVFYLERQHIIQPHKSHSASALLYFDKSSQHRDTDHTAMQTRMSMATACMQQHRGC